MTAREAAQRICDTLYNISDDYVENGYRELGDCIFTIASALSSVIADGEFGE